MDGVPGETLLTVQLRDLVRQSGTQSPIGVDDVAVDLDGQALSEGWLGLVDKLVVKTDVELVVLLAHFVGSGARSHLVGGLEKSAEVEIGGLGCAEAVVYLQKIGSAHHLVDRAHTKLRHDRTKLLRQVIEEVDDMLGFAREFGSQLGVLSGDTCSTNDEKRLEVSILDGQVTKGRDGGNKPIGHVLRSVDVGRCQRRDVDKEGKL